MRAIFICVIALFFAGFVFAEQSADDVQAEAGKEEKVTITVRDQTTELVNNVQSGFNRLRSYSWSEHFSQ